jgi:hypothetical protein
MSADVSPCKTRQERLRFASHRALGLVPLIDSQFATRQGHWMRQVTPSGRRFRTRAMPARPRNGRTLRVGIQTRGALLAEEHASVSGADRIGV